MLRLALVVWLMAAGWAAAAPVRVDSGEHPGFSRLALRFSAPVDWQLGRVDGGYALRVDQPGLAYDLSQVFRRIPRSRLAAVEHDTQAGLLRLRLGCACHAEAFVGAQGTLVIDIRDGAPDPGSVFETALAVPQPRPEPAPPAGPNYDWLEALRQQHIPAPDLPPAPDARLAELRESLLPQLARAVAMGVADPVGKMPRNAQPPVPAAPPAETPPTAAPLPPPPQMRILPADGGTGPGFAADGAVCPADALFDLAAWAPAGPPAEALGPLRAGLIGEFDRPSAEGVVALARLYLHAGFGAEARNLLENMEIAVPGADLLLLLAVLVDGGTPAGPHPLQGLTACDGAVALWAVLAQPTLPPGERVNNDAVIRAFSALPLHLRHALGPGLADRFIGIGAAGTARAIGDAIARAPGDHGAALGMIEARLDLAHGAHATGEGRLRAIVAEDGSHATHALIALVESVVARGEALDGPSLLALEAAAREGEGGEDGPALHRALVLGLAANGRFAEAFARLPDRPAALHADVWRILAQRGDDAALLRHAITRSAPPPPAPTRTAIARRLLDLGFAAEARAWVEEDAAIPGMALLIAVQADLALRDGRSALRRLQGQTGADAARLRARALVLLGNPAEAAAAWREAGSGAEAATALWRARDWPGAAMDPEGGPRQAAAAQLTAESEPAPAEITLAASRAVLEQARAQKAAVARMLDALPRPATGP